MSHASGRMHRIDLIIREFRYRPDVDGLRAVAVLAVVIFHAGLGLPGGFIGVDVFFVISGFLITSVIVTDVQEGRFTLAHFWERRARRIIPALGAVVVGTLIAGWFLLLPRDYAALGRSAAWQSIFAANFYFCKTTIGGYFASATEEMPLLHTWSLAVEEQFYLIVPLTFVALCRFRRFCTRRFLLLLFGAALLVSLLCSVYGVAHYRIASFYLLPTRAWELLIGSILAIVPPGWMTTNRFERETLACVGLAAILIPCLSYHAEIAFPGLAALLPCLGTALIIRANSAADRDAPPTSLSRVLSSPPVVFVGLISYSLYLWHWPVFAFWRYYWADKPLLPGSKWAMIALSFGLAIISWRWIEIPFRRKAVCASTRNVFTYAATTLVVTFLFGAAVGLLQGLPQRYPKEVRASLLDRPQSDLYRTTQMRDLAAGNFARLGVRDPSHRIDVLVWGDSHGLAVMPAFDSVLQASGLSGEAVIRACNVPALGYYYEHPFALGKDALKFSAEVISYTQQRKIPHVVLVGYWRAYPATNASGSLECHLLSTVQRLVLVGAQPWIMLDVPGANCDVGKVLRRGSWGSLNAACFCKSPDSENGIIGTDPLLLDRLTKAGARFIDPRPAFLNASHDRYLNAKQGTILYWDSHHLTTLAAKETLIPILEETFLPYLKPPAISANVP